MGKHKMKNQLYQLSVMQLLLVWEGMAYVNDTSFLMKLFLTIAMDLPS